MILVPGHQVDLSAPPTARSTSGPPVTDAGLQAALEPAGRRIEAWGADAVGFRRRVLEAVAAAPSLADPVTGLPAAGAVAGWRSGVLGLRDDALTTAARLLDDEGPEPVGRLLGVAVPDVAAFLEAQRTDRFAWPGWRRLDRAYVVARVGGFAGLGGAWTRPPVEPRRHGAGSWSLRTGEQAWRVEIDLFGHVLTPLSPVSPVSPLSPVSPDERDEALDAGDLTPAEAEVELMVTSTSYLAHLVRTPGAAGGGR